METVELSQFDYALAQKIGKARNEQTLQSGAGKASSKADPDRSHEDVHIMGAAGEVATARFLALDLDQVGKLVPGGKGQGGDLTMPDGRRIEVKTTKKRGFQLALPHYQGSKLKSDLYVLVWPRFESHVFDLVGWIDREAFRHQGEFKKLRHGQQWTLKPDRLRPMSKLEALPFHTLTMRSALLGRDMAFVLHPDGSVDIEDIHYTKAQLRLLARLEPDKRVKHHALRILHAEGFEEAPPEPARNYVNQRKQKARR